MHGVFFFFFINICILYREHLCKKFPEKLCKSVKFIRINHVAATAVWDLAIFEFNTIVYSVYTTRRRGKRFSNNICVITRYTKSVLSLREYINIVVITPRSRRRSDRRRHHRRPDVCRWRISRGSKGGEGFRIAYPLTSYTTRSLL